ncbi:CvpA family protein [Thermoflexus sp.]|uniref:CvpA family protein n=1 Tax=Thermoflexus sp. TaxID=1969742 RepID=UPI002ADDB19B|nr:CvpA family protein [Thermoflexus sp.]
MIALHMVFWAFVLLFALIGALRGVAKEILVSASIVGVMFFFSLLQQFAPAVWESFTRDPATGFFAETIAIGIAAFFGYAGPALSVQLAGRAKREKGVEIIAGFAAGAINGWLIAGSILFFLHRAGYPFPEVLQPPGPNSPVMDLLSWMPPAVLKPPLLYFMVVIMLFALLVFYL